MKNKSIYIEKIIFRSMRINIDEEKFKQKTVRGVSLRIAESNSVFLRNNLLYNYSK